MPEDNDLNQQSIPDSQAELTHCFPGDRAILVEWECSDGADRDVQLRFDRARDAVLDTIDQSFMDFQELSSGGTDRAGHQYLGDLTGVSNRE